MIKIKKLFFLWIVSPFWISCNEKETNSNNSINEYYHDGKLKVTYQINEDSLLNGKFIKYFYSGDIEEKLNYQNGLLFGEQFFYNDKGDLIKYAVVDGFKDVIYVLKFDEKGNKIKEEGMAISPNIYCPKCEGNTIFLNDTVLFNVMVATPPETKITVESIIFKLNREKKATTLKVYENNVVAFQEIFNEIGEYQLILIATLFDKNYEVYLSDTIVKKITVVYPR